MLTPVPAVCRALCRQMWVYEEMFKGKKLTEIINEKHENVKYLPGVSIPDNVVANPDLVDAVTGASLLVFVLPHQVSTWAWRVAVMCTDGGDIWWCVMTGCCEWRLTAAVPLVATVLEEHPASDQAGAAPRGTRHLAHQGTTGLVCPPPMCASCSLLRLARCAPLALPCRASISTTRGWCWCLTSSARALASTWQCSWAPTWPKRCVNRFVGYGTRAMRAMRHPGR